MINPESWNYKLAFNIRKLIFLCIVFLPAWILIDWFARYFSVTLREVILGVVAFHIGRTYRTDLTSKPKDESP